MPGAIDAQRQPLSAIVQIDVIAVLPAARGVERPDAQRGVGRQHGRQPPVNGGDVGRHRAARHRRIVQLPLEHQQQAGERLDQPEAHHRDAHRAVNASNPPASHAPALSRRRIDGGGRRGTGGMAIWPGGTDKRPAGDRRHRPSSLDCALQQGRRHAEARRSGPRYPPVHPVRAGGLGRASGAGLRRHEPGARNR